MNIFKRYSILASLMVLTSCSYFSTNEELSVSSKDLSSEELRAIEGRVVEDPSFKWSKVQRIARHKPKGTVEIYDLDVSEEEAMREYAPSINEREAARSAGVLIMSPGVEIYPIDISMQRTIKPVR